MATWSCGYMLFGVVRPNPLGAVGSSPGVRQTSSAQYKKLRRAKINQSTPRQLPLFNTLFCALVVAPPPRETIISLEPSIFIQRMAADTNYRLPAVRSGARAQTIGRPLVGRLWPVFVVHEHGRRRDGGRVAALVAGRGHHVVANHVVGSVGVQRGDGGRRLAPMGRRHGGGQDVVRVLRRAHGHLMVVRLRLLVRRFQVGAQRALFAGAMS